MYLGGPSAFVIAWLANFKLLLFAFGKGPLSSSMSLARFVAIGLELEPQFNEPYLSSSLQDFWGRRWNLVVSGILRPTIYEPTRNLATCLMDRNWAPIPAILGTFIVSGLMHELVFYYLGREKPTWELTCFFLLHGVCQAIEVALKKAFARSWQFPWLISGPLTIGFVMVTGFWLFLPSMHRCKVFERSTIEFAAAVDS
ncbi:hypothetical protein GH714_017138 [Hevea brasiliensis]|uniref:Wax synthase domain-containing protein n=1 Tax=Hevea brasiliensis TaxID=3981 RepID=A0A6A6K539_HEVBR|nr:hypothetical protein GH714_017138 [Hevea brasiliensis]